MIREIVHGKEDHIVVRPCGRSRGYDVEPPLEMVAYGTGEEALLLSQARAQGSEESILVSLAESDFVVEFGPSYSFHCGSSPPLNSVKMALKWVKWR